MLARTVQWSLFLAVLMLGTPVKAPAYQALQLQVQDLQVYPSFLVAGERVRVTARIINAGSTPVYQLQIGVAVAETSRGTITKWVVLENSHAAPIEYLGPSQSVDFSGAAMIEGNGWVRVGVAGRADGTHMFPSGKPVRVTKSLTLLLTDLLFLFVTYALLLCSTLVGVWLIFHSKGSQTARWVPFRPLVAGGLGLGVLSLILLYLSRIVFSINPPLGATMVYVAIAVFAGGWLVVGMGLRPRGSVLRGASLATLLYVIIGAMWVVTFNVGILGYSATVLAEQPVSQVILGLGWPLQIAQVVGLFGLTF